MNSAYDNQYNPPQASQTSQPQNNAFPSDEEQDYISEGEFRFAGDLTKMSQRSLVLKNAEKFATAALIVEAVCLVIGFIVPVVGFIFYFLGALLGFTIAIIPCCNDLRGIEKPGKIKIALVASGVMVIIGIFSIAATTAFAVAIANFFGRLF